MSYDWRRAGVFYQVYPRSFADSNGDGVGDLRGITGKLEHIASLGVDGVWLSPFFRSPMKDYGYDVSDYTDVDPLFGTLADFDALLKRAHELGLKLIIDQVYSHSSDQHAWFKESRASKDNAKKDWYVWADPKPDGTPPNNWQAMFGGPAWTWDSRRRQYYFHNFLPEQPDLNVRNPEVADALLAAAKFWLDRGVDGFRLDVVNFYTHDPLLRDNPPRPFVKPPHRPNLFQWQRFAYSQPDTLAFIARLRGLADSYPDRYLLGEIGDDNPLARQKEYTATPERLHSAYAFTFLNARRPTPALFTKELQGWEGPAGAPAWSLSNHDVPRFPTRLANDDPARTRLLMLLLLTLRGGIYLYQGDELGLPQGEVPFERLRDPEEINFYPNGIGRDGARTPMPWKAQDGMAGFTSADDAWLPLDPRHAALAADRQEADAGSMLHFTRRMIALRKAHPALTGENWQATEAPDGVLAFTREGGGEKLLCVFNLGEGEVRVPVAARAIETLNGASVASNEIVLPVNGAAICAV